MRPCKTCGKLFAHFSNLNCDSCKRDKIAHRLMIKKVHSLLNQAINKGLVIKGKICEVCDKKLYLEAHHPEYDRPYDVLWLCRKCHRTLHKAFATP